MYAELYLHETNIPRKTVTSICTCWLDVMYQPRSSVCTRRISLGLMINEDMPLTSSKRLIFGGIIIALWLTGKSFSAVKWELMKLTRRARVSLLSETGMFSMSLWMPSALIIKWLSSLTFAALGQSSSVRPLDGGGGGLGPDFQIIVMLGNGALSTKQNLSNAHEFVVC